MKIDRGEREPQLIIGVHGEVPMAGLSEFFGRAFAEVMAALDQQGVPPAGPPVAFYAGATEQVADVTAGFPVIGSVVPARGLVALTLPGGPTVEATYVGAYDGLADAYAALTRWFEEQGLTPSAAMWEEYLVGPATVADPGRWQTRIVYPMG